MVLFEEFFELCGVSRGFGTPLCSCTLESLSFGTSGFLATAASILLPYGLTLRGLTVSLSFCDGFYDD